MSLAALADQIVVSGTNFAVGILIARFCSVSDYGTYVVAFTCLLTLNSLQSSLITDPLGYVCPSLTESQALRYATSLALCQIGVAVCSAAVLAAGALGVRLVGGTSELVAGLLYLLPVVILFQIREFLRRMMFARFLMSAAVLADLLYGTLVMAGIAAIFRFGMLTAVSAFGVLGAGSLAASALSAYGLRYEFARRIRASDIRQVVTAHWGFGRWHLLGSLGSYGYMEAQTFIVAYLLGTSMAANVQAARNLLLPVQLLLLGVGNFASPRAARVFSQGGRPALGRYVLRLGWVFCGFTVLYCGMAVAVPEWALNLFYAGKYNDAVPLVRLWALVYLLFALRRVPSVGVVAMRRPDIAVRAGLTAGGLALAVCYPTVRMLGVEGSLWVRVIAEAVLLAIVGLAFLKPGIEDRPVVRTVIT